jgi:hypothetical protein
VGVTCAGELPPKPSLLAKSRGQQSYRIEEELITLLHDLAARVGTACGEHEYGDNKAIWLEDGNRVLDYMEADERFNAASFKESMEEQGVVISKNNLTTLIDNMRSLVNQWRRSVGEHGELVFYIDARKAESLSSQLG